MLQRINKARNLAHQVSLQFSCVHGYCDHGKKFCPFQQPIRLLDSQNTTRSQLKIKITTIVSSQSEMQCLHYVVLVRQKTGGRRGMWKKHYVCSPPPLTSLSPDKNRMAFWVTKQVCTLKPACTAGYFMWVSQFEQAFALV